MIIQTEKEKILTSLSNKERQFTISSSPKAFAVLMEGLYSNKIMAIVRELSSNAYDAHIQAGTTRSFEITAPTSLAPTFSVRDYGESMEHDFVMRLYSSVFFSSKEDSNDQVGTFGLGSKSPFAYADTFNLSTFIGGVERIYSCFLNPERIPCIVLLAETATNAPDGTLVSFDVSAKDIKEFEQSIKRIVKAYWRHPPIVHNLEVSNKQPRRLNQIDIDEVFVFTSTTNYKTTTYYFSQGNVWYPVPVEFLNRSSKTYAQLDVFEIAYNSSIYVVLEVPVGTFNITPSRESISLDKFSIASINEYIQNLQARIVDKVKDIYAPCKTRLDYSKIYRSLRGCGIASKLIDHKYISEYNAKKNLHNATNLLSASTLRVLDDRYYIHDTPQWKTLPKDDVKLSECKPGFLYSPGHRANTWHCVTQLASGSYFDWSRVRLFSGLEYKLVRKATRLKNHLDRTYLRRETELVCFSEDLPRFVRTIGLSPDQIISIASIPDPGPPASSKKTQTITIPAKTKSVWKPDDAFVVVVQYGYISARDPYCALKYNGNLGDRITYGDVNNFLTYLKTNMNNDELKLIGNITFKTVNWDNYDEDDTNHLYKKIVTVLGEDKVIEIMLRPVNIFSVDDGLEWEKANYGFNPHPFKQFISDVLTIEGHVLPTNGNRYSMIPMSKCPFTEVAAKAHEAEEKKKLELKAQKAAILDKYPMFKIRDRKQLTTFLEESKCITSSTS